MVLVLEYITGFNTPRVLIERGADVNVLNESGVHGSSLHYAIMQVFLEGIT